MFAASVGQQIDYVARLWLPHWENLLPTWNAFAMKVALAPMSRCRSNFDAFAVARGHRCAAQQAGAANFLMWRGDHWYCDNTDGAGLVRDIETNQGVALRGKRVLLLGAGGTVRGCDRAAVAARARALVVVNRTHATAVELVGHYAAQYPGDSIDRRTAGCDWTALRCGDQRHLGKP